MTQMFAVTCDCGECLDVTVAQAGSEIDCGRCGQSVRIPTLSKLRELAGQGFSMLSSWDRMKQLALGRKSPFAMACQGCSETATLCVPLEISCMMERTTYGDGGVTVTPAFVTATVAASTERWDKAVLPLLFCDKCYGNFRNIYRWKTVGFWLAVPFLIVLCVSLLVIAKVLGALAFVGMLVLLSRVLRGKKLDRRWDDWLNRIPIVADALRGESEVRYRAGAVRLADPNISQPVI